MTAMTLKARDVMTRKVLTVSPDTPVRSLARFLVDHRISGLGPDGYREALEWLREATASA